jgi:hypothetical protein
MPDKLGVNNFVLSREKVPKESSRLDKIRTVALFWFSVNVPFAVEA